MFIYEKGAILKNSKENKKFQVSVLVADIFELNTDLKAMMVIDIDEYNSNIDYMSEISNCDIFECVATAIGNNFSCIFEDIFVEADYCNGSIIRLYLHIENYEHQNCQVVSNNYDIKNEILNDL